MADALSHPTPNLVPPYGASHIPNLSFPEMKKLILLLTLALSMGASASVPVKRVSRHTQPDGTTLTVVTKANGQYFLHTTTDGIPLVQQADGGFCYALTQGNQLVASARAAHNAEARTADEAHYVATLNLSEEHAMRLLHDAHPEPLYNTRPAPLAVASTADGLGLYKQSGGGIVSSIGAPVIPVVMIDFSDLPFQEETTVDKVTRYLNEEGYQDEKYAIGSVRDYFVSQSDSLFQPTYKVVAKVRADKGYAYYGKDSGNSIDVNITALIQEALNKAVAAGADFADYATNGQVPLVCVYFAGVGQQAAYGEGWQNYVWGQFNSSRKFTMQDGALTINSYLVANEMLYYYSNDYTEVTSMQHDGIGLFVHEFGHALGLCDMYVTQNAQVPDDYKTMGFWSIMDYGEFYYDGYRPVAYNAYERCALGWADYKVLSEPGTYTLYPSERSSEGTTVYVMRNPDKESEYYLLENRQEAFWHGSRLGKGMLVLHVDYDATPWRNNTPNNDATHPRVVVVPADNVLDGGPTAENNDMNAIILGHQGDLFPGTANNTSLTDTSLPAATVYTDRSTLGQPLYFITQHADGLITFNYIDDIPEGIARPGLVSPEANAPVYTLSGQRVSSLRHAAPGVYIVGGRKVVK